MAAVVSGNAAATVNNILASEPLFRLGIVPELICGAEFVFLLWDLYRLLGAVNKTHASLMVILGLVSIPIMFMNSLHEIAALALLRGAVFDQPQRQALAVLFLNCMERDSLSPGSVGACGFSPSGFGYLRPVSSAASWASR